MDLCVCVCVSQTFFRTSLFSIFSLSLPLFYKNTASGENIYFTNKDAIRDKTFSPPPHTHTLCVCLSLFLHLSTLRRTTHNVTRRARQCLSTPFLKYSRAIHRTFTSSERFSKTLCPQRQNRKYSFPRITNIVYVVKLCVSVHACVCLSVSTCACVRMFPKAHFQVLRPLD